MIAPESLQPAIVVGRYGENQLGEGWHERETDGRYGIPYRASSHDATLVLRREQNANTLHILMSGSLGLAPAGLEGAVRIGERLFPMKLSADAWVLRKIPLVDLGETLEIRFLMPNPIIPDYVIHNGDARALGWFLTAIWQE